MPSSAWKKDVCRSEEHTSELQSLTNLVCRLLLEKKHDVVDHAVEYVRDNVHTNGCENFWSLLKRGLHGTYISVEPFHLFRYVDEQAFRFNNRHTNDAERFVLG